MDGRKFMSKTILVTVSDDRFGRKDSQYGITQDKIHAIFRNNPQFGIDEAGPWTWDDIAFTNFYLDNKKLLDQSDAGMNGRAYKPFAIQRGLIAIKEGDFLIYTDCSPEIWNMPADWKFPEIYKLDILKDLCVKNNDILTAFVKWDNKHIPSGELGIHTHHNFTTNRCMNVMGLQKHRFDYMHASGMWVIRKNKYTVDFVDEWLKWNCIDECASLGPADGDGSNMLYWWQEEHVKMGHRHDQSISGLLINKIGNKLVEIPDDCLDMHPYNPLQFARTDVNYKFIDSINHNIQNTEGRAIQKGDQVINSKGTVLTVFEIRPENGVDWLIVGKHPASAYRTVAENVKLKI
jgi:hypothetical protein